jgi:hypothetical protein
MKIAIYYTGEIRTIEKTIDNFKKNLLLNDDYHVFAILQTDEREKTLELVKNKIGNNLKYFEYYNKDDFCWKCIQNNLLSTIIINSDNNWIEYLQNRSGSMIEYHQMYKAFHSMVNYEMLNNFKYDYVIRIRCDVILTKPIYFNWDSYDEKYINEYINEIMIKNNMNIKEDRVKIITILMNSLYCKLRIYNNIEMKASCYISNDYLKNIINIEDNNIFIKELVKYIKRGKYIITLRNNVIYFIKRKYITSIAPLGLMYGLYKEENNPYWFNAESQLKQICIENEIDIFNSHSQLEEDSLYNYNENNYYKNGELIDNFNNVFFFIKRK